MRWTYHPSLDGLRTIAVYLVLLFHTGLPWAEGGFTGVDLFFVLSGFLVTNVLLSELDTTGSLHLARFYGRRVRRLLPAAVVVIVSTSAIFLVISSVVRRLPMVADAQSALLYFANWHFLGQAGDYFATDIDKSPFLHFWSLSIEEQYYLLFPLLLMVLLRRGRRWVLGGLAVVFTLSLASQVYWGRVDSMHAYYGTDARLYQLLGGAMLAVALGTRTARVTARGAALLTSVSLAGLLVLASGLIDVSPSTRGIGAMVASVLLVAGLMLGEGSLVARTLSRPIPVFLGKISYGTYLWHWPVIVVLKEFLTVGPVLLAAISAAVATGLAALSYEILEMPIRKSATLGRLGWSPTVIGVAASATVAVTLVPWVLQLDRKPELVALANVNPSVTVQGEGSRAVPTGIDWKAVNRDVGGTGTCTADDVAACTVVQGDGPHVLLVGDSQAQMLVPMFKKLARTHGFTLSLNVTPGCPWQEGLDNLKQAPGSREKCAAERVGWYESVLPKLRPDVVILLDRPRDNPAEWSDLIKRRDGKQQPLDQAVHETTHETLQTISALVPHVLLVDRLIMPETFQPADCLATAAKIGECAVPVPMSPSTADGFFITEAAQSDRISTVNLNPAFCPGAPVCQPIVGDQVVWRDDHHYTASYGLARRDQVWKILSATGLF